MKNINHPSLRCDSIIILLILAILCGCTSKESKQKDVSKKEKVDYVSYENEVNFLENYIDLIQLTDSSKQSRVAISKALQGRVMTSSSKGEIGRSYGWINHELFKSRDTLEHINVFGGEERFWLGPEGGQYSIFFKKGSQFTLDDWYTPKLIDLEHFEVKNLSPSKVVFTKTASLVNYSGFQFDLGIEREIQVLSTQETSKELSINSMEGINMVAYKTINSIANIGTTDWQKESGLLSIWLLGMFNPSEATTVVIPFKPGTNEELGIPVNDTYFGKVPSDRLVVTDSVLYFSGDGEYRSKIGLSPKRAKNMLGSYDATNAILTIVKYNQPKNVNDYVNSMWEIQEKPYRGDVVNSYNDGSPAPGEPALGPFYELETSSPALALKVGESRTHVQLTCHFEGESTALNQISKKLLGVSLEEITTAIKK